MKWKIPKAIAAPAIVLAGFAVVALVMGALFGILAAADYFIDDDTYAALTGAGVIVFLVLSLTIYFSWED